MLTELSVNNLSLLRELKFQLGEGLNILTGATGAGKSILVGAIGLLLGARVEAHMIRKGAPSATVEGVFELASRKALVKELQEMGLSLDQDVLILKREISEKGDSRAYANGSRITLAQLKRVGDLLVDLHGQHDHQSLLRPAEHLTLLDDYGGFLALREETKKHYRQLATYRQELQNLTRSYQNKQERRELIEFQLREIDQLRPRVDEDVQLENERSVLENVEQLFQGVNAAYHSLFEEDNAIIQRLSMIQQTLEGLTPSDAALETSSQEFASCIYQLEDLSSKLRQYAQRLHRDPERLAEVQERIHHLKYLKTKYGGSLAAVLLRREELAAEIESLSKGDERLKQLAEKVRQAEERFGQSCQRLSAARKKAASMLQKEVERELGNLGMPKTRFAVEMKQVEDEAGEVQISNRKLKADAAGMDQIEFLLSPNPGEGLRPLAKIASGGEISRIMLAMKAILAHVDKVPLLIFDEIDVGIGGEVAESVGQALKVLARSHQVLCITHLHQIASLADEHLLVWKKQREGRTETVIRSLSIPERIEEIARMMAGEEITEITLDHAREMLSRGKKPKASLG